MNLVVVGKFDLDDIVKVLKGFESVTSSNSFLKIFSPVILHPVIQNETSRMEVASPKLAIGIRGRNLVPSPFQYRYKIIIKLLFLL